MIYIIHINMIDSFDNLSDYSKDSNPENTFNNSSAGITRSDKDPNILTKESNQEQINFINFTQHYCIGFIDIINSTQETAKIKDPKKLRKYYSLFLNSMSAILNQYNGKVVKNSGDNLFFYFPKTSNLRNQQALQDVFDCSTSMIKSCKPLNQELAEEDLPFRSITSNSITIIIPSYRQFFLIIPQVQLVFG